MKRPIAKCESCGTWNETDPNTNFRGDCWKCGALLVKPAEYPLPKFEIWPQPGAYGLVYTRPAPGIWGLVKRLFRVKSGWVEEHWPKEAR